MTIKSHPYTVEYFKEMPFYKKPIEKPKIKLFPKTKIKRFPKMNFPFMKN